MRFPCPPPTRCNRIANTITVVNAAGFGLTLLMGMIAIPFIAVGLVVPWAMLGQSRLPIRVVVLLIVASAAAWLTLAYWNAPELTWVLLADAAVLAVTLLIARVCGYRLVRLNNAR
jgi:hypothetical protein